jgi:DGQHR domain-containing protein
MKLPIIEINQNDNIFYITKMCARDLMGIATTKVRKSYSPDMHQNYLNEVDERIRTKISEGDIWYLKDLSEDANVQRNDSKKRLKEIGEYISKSNSLFPNAIIVSLNLRDPEDEIEKVLKIENNVIEFDEKKVVMTIIDGQHRLGGFKYSDDVDFYLNNFELVVSLMVNLDVAIQAELFATINGKQKPVNKSILYDLSELSEDEYSEILTAHLIVKWFNVDKKSPLHGMIKMLGTGEGTISQSAFIDALLPLLEERNMNSENKIMPVFSKYYKNKDSKTIMRYLFNYFKCFKEIFPDEWNYKSNTSDSKRYILNKTTGISGILFAFPTIFAYMKLKGDTSYEFLQDLIFRLKTNNFDFSSEKYGGGSKSIQNTLADDILDTIFPISNDTQTSVDSYTPLKIRSNWIQK